MNPKIITKKTAFRKKKPALGKFFYWLTFFVFLGTIIYLLFFSPFLVVAKINLNGIQKLDRDLVMEKISRQLSGEYFKYFKKNNLILARKSLVEKTLKENFKRVEEVGIKKKFPDTLEVSILERKPALVFCSGEDCRVLDEKGRAFAQVNFEFPELGEDQLIIFRDQSNKPVDAKEVLISQEYLKFISDVRENTKRDLDIDLEREFETPNRSSLDLRTRTIEGWKIYFNQEISLEKELGMLRVVLDNKIQDKRGNLEYVDLRSDNKVYYKFKEGTQEEMKQEEEQKPPEEKPAEKKKKKK